jgi:hypothetical protein
MIHERMSTVLRIVGLQDGIVSMGGAALVYSWWVLLVPVMLVIGVLLARFFWSLPRRTKCLIAVAVVVYLLGSVGVEIYESWYNNTFLGDYVSPIVTGLEEALEMVGISTAIYAFLDYIQSSKLGPKR